MSDQRQTEFVHLTADERAAMREAAAVDHRDPHGNDGVAMVKVVQAILGVRLAPFESLLADLDEEVAELRDDVPPVGPARVAHMYRIAGLSDARDRLRMALTTAGGESDG